MDLNQQPCGCGSKGADSIRVIVDVDPGFDDAWALFLLIREHQNPVSNVSIEVITVTNGNTVVDNGVRNINRILEAMGVSGIPAYRGSEIAMVIPWVDEVLYHGNDGFGDSGLPDPTVNETRPGNAVDKIVELAQRHSKQLTFLALALNKLPEIYDAFARVIILGGNYLGFGSMSPAAGFNFFTDVEAARVVLERVTSPMVVPDETLIDYATFPKQFRTNTLGRLRMRQVEMMNRAENTHLARNNQTWAAADALAAAIVLEPSIVTKTEPHFCAVELHGELTRGMIGG